MKTTSKAHGRDPLRTRARIHRAVLLPVGGMAALAILAACGSGSNDGSGANNANTGKADSSKAIVSAQDTPNAGTILVDSSGKTLYFSDEEKNGSISCTGSCLGFWFPLTASGKTVPTPDGVSGKLSTLKRPDDGKQQVTYNGAPLYTFKLDTSDGDMKGNNFSDDFGKSHFTWHAAGADKSAKGATPTATGGSDGGYNNNY